MDEKDKDYTKRSTKRIAEIFKEVLPFDLAYFVFFRIYDLLDFCLSFWLCFLFLVCISFFVLVYILYGSALSYFASKLVDMLTELTLF